MFFLKKLFTNHQKKKPSEETVGLYSSLAKNLNYLQTNLSHSSDLKWEQINFNNKKGILIYLESVTDREKIEKKVIYPLHKKAEGVIEEILPIAQFKKIAHLNKLPLLLVKGNCILILEGLHEAYVMGVMPSYSRSISEPSNEQVVRGAHDGFIENLTTNLYLIRHRIESTKLKVHYYEVGEITKTKVAVLYMQDIVNPKLVAEVDRRITSISTDTIASTGIIGEFIETSPLSPFPQILYTERPDRTAVNIMEGRVAILTEGDSSAMILPVTISAFYQSPDDYNSKWIIGSFIRLIRLASILIAFQLPAVYIAVVGFHPEILPTELIFTVQSSVGKVPFPPILEAILMELTLEVIREAGLRLPSRVGQTIGIVGGLVIGESVVRAGLVSYPMIIVVSLTAIASFVVPSHEMSTAIRILRFPLMVLSALFGIVGISVGLLFILIHLCRLESFGTPFLAPFSPLRMKDLKDTFVRFPIWKLNQRPHDIHPQRMTQEDYSRGWDADGQKEQ
ncbi:spore germination protein [Shimazuella kribbensis]|uniref:spore germination protein n=1 Tax=Shimazuella kribbensis TaxID=139808 RepID=UPI0004084B61|nr:spore germination protein [Shimazuella kribbensis]